MGQSVRDAHECSMYCDSTNYCFGFSIDSTNSPAKCWLLGAFSENAVNSGRCVAATAEQFGAWCVATDSSRRRNRKAPGSGACSDDKDCGEEKYCAKTCGVYGRNGSCAANWPSRRRT